MIVSNKDYVKAQQEAIANAKKGKEKTWVDDLREGRTCPKDGVIRLKLVGEKTAERMKEHGIETVETVMTNTPEQLATMTKGEIKVTTFQTIQRNNKDNYDTTKKPSSFVKDHRHADNPYLSKYGDDWETAIRKTPELQNKENVRNLVRACVRFGERHFSKNDKDWMICHDSLSMFVAKENRDWMKEEKVQDGRTYRDVFLFPEDGLNAGIPGYQHRWVGNSPEFMPWDCSLFQDLEVSLRHHVVITSKLANDDPRKFSLRSPAQIDSAIHRLLDPQFTGEEGAPKASRIRGDIRKVLESYKQVVKAEGAFVKGIGNRTGKRADKVSDEAKKRGGSRPHNTKADEAEFMWLHPHAQAALENLVANYGNLFDEHESPEIVDGDDE